MSAEGTIERAIEVEVAIEAEAVPRAVAARSEIELPHEFRSVVMTAILAIMFFYTLYFARAVFVPLLLAMLLRLFLELPMKFLGRFHIPRAIAAILVIVGLFGGLGLLGTALGGPASEW